MFKGLFCTIPVCGPYSIFTVDPFKEKHNLDLKLLSCFLFPCFLSPLSIKRFWIKFTEEGVVRVVTSRQISPAPLHAAAVCSLCRRTSVCSHLLYIFVPCGTNAWRHDGESAPTCHGEPWLPAAGDPPSAKVSHWSRHCVTQVSLAGGHRWSVRRSVRRSVSTCS